MLCEIFALSVIGIENVCLFRGVSNRIFQQNTLFLRVKLDKESIPELRFFIYLENSFRTSWFTAYVFRETVTASVVCSVRVVTLTEHTMNNCEP